MRISKNSEAVVHGWIHVDGKRWKNAEDIQAVKKPLSHLENPRKHIRITLTVEL